MKTTAILLLACLLAGRVFGAGYTPIVNNLNLQAEQVTKELKVSENERRCYLNLSTAEVINVMNQNLQSVSFWSNMQVFCETYCTNFVNHVQTRTDGRWSVITNFTTQTWWQATGMTNGWRKVTGTNWPANWANYEDPTYSYGKCAPDDVLGPWHWKDLQVAFDTMRQLQWEVKDPMTNDYLKTVGYMVAVGNGHTSGASARTNAYNDCVAAWSVAAWDTDKWSFNQFYQVKRELLFQTFDPYWVYTETRIRSEPCLSTNRDIEAHACSNFLVKTSTLSFNWDFYVMPLSYGRTPTMGGQQYYYDMDGYGLNTNTTYWSYDSGVSQQNTAYRAVAKSIGDESVAPFDLTVGFGAWTDPDNPGGAYRESVYSRQAMWLIKPNWSYKDY
jgi:hypothetical protein